MAHSDHDHNHDHDPDDTSLPDPNVADRRDAIYTVLANKHQRAVLTWFGHHHGTHPDDLDGATAMRTTLADHLSTQFSMTEAQATATLYHSVLPRLADMGLLSHASEEGSVRVNSHEGVAAILRVQAAAEAAFDGHDPVSPLGEE